MKRLLTPGKEAEPMQKKAGHYRRTSDNREVRQLRRELANVKRETRGDDGALITGLAAVFYQEGDSGTEYWLWSDTVERIHPGAFDRAINEQHDARGLFNHDSNQLLGRVSSGTCRLSVTAEGLAYEIDADDGDPDSQRVCAKIDRRDVTGSSFAFIARKVTWEEQKLEDGWLYIRNIYDVDLFDVGPVTWPAYEATTAGRSSDALFGDPAGEYAELLREREQHLRSVDDEQMAMRVRLLELDE